MTLMIFNNLGQGSMITKEEKRKKSYALTKYEEAFHGGLAILIPVIIR